MLPTPTFNCCVVGFDVFEQPVSIHLGAAAEHRGLTSPTSSDSNLMADQSHCCLIISSTAPNDIQNHPSFRSVTLCWAVVSDSKFKFSSNKDIWCGDSGGEVKADFLPVAHWQCFSRTRSVEAALNQKGLGTLTSEHMYFLPHSSSCGRKWKRVPVTKNRTVGERTDLLFTGSWLKLSARANGRSWSGRAKVTESHYNWHGYIVLFLKLTRPHLIRNLMKNIISETKNVPKANG